MPPGTARYRWTSSALPLDAANAALAVLALLIIGRLLKARVGIAAWWSANGLLLVLATVASAVWLPGLGFAFQLPLIVLLALS